MNVVVLLATGFEELEAVTIVDVLRRAGISVLLAGIAPPPIEGGHGIKVVPDLSIDDVTTSFRAGALGTSTSNAINAFSSSYAQHTTPANTSARFVLPRTCSAWRVSWEGRGRHVIQGSKSRARSA